jgi:hypothetical protein
MEEFNFSISPLNNSNEYRGYFIAEFSKLERAIDLYLAKYFMANENDINQFISILIDRLTFENKAIALKTLFDKKEVYVSFINEGMSQKNGIKISLMS